MLPTTAGFRATLPYTAGPLSQYLGLVVGLCSISLLLFGVAGCAFWLRGHVLETKTEAAGLDAGLETEA
ncbi:MAG: hypothetical protein ACYC99_16030 [Candidatus Geothermincolia bacterium]